MENITIQQMSINHIIEKFKVPYNIAKNINEAIKQQQKIGWNQIINGRISKKMGIISHNQLDKILRNMVIRIHKPNIYIIPQNLSLIHI